MNLRLALSPSGRIYYLITQDDTKNDVQTKGVPDEQTQRIRIAFESSSADGLWQLSTRAIPG